MKISSVRGIALWLAILASTSLLHAHPGHDGHELTWDFRHLATYPLASIGCVAVAVGCGGLAWYVVRRLIVSRSDRLALKADRS